MIGAPRLSIYHYEGFADYRGNHVAASLHLGDRFAVGLSLRRHGWDHVIEDELDVPLPELRTGESQYAATLALRLGRALQLGIVGARFVSDNLSVRIAATTWSFGTLIDYAKQGRLGVAVLHFGKEVDSDDGWTYAMPTTVRIGLSQMVTPSFTVVVDGAWASHTFRAWSGHAGFEWRAPAFVVLRAGMETFKSDWAAEREGRFAGGLGVIGGPLEVSISTRFGGIAGSQEWFVGVDAFRARSSKAGDRD